MGRGRGGDPEDRPAMLSRALSCQDGAPQGFVASFKMNEEKPSDASGFELRIIMSPV